MTSILAAVDGREKGAIPVSIGTSLAVEAACGVFPDRPVSPAPLTLVKELWFNVRTLLRNLIGVIPTEFKDDLMPPHLLQAMLEELGILESAVAKGSDGLARAVFYCCDYTPMARKFPKANLRTPKTPKQLVQQALEDRTIASLLQDGSAPEIRLFRFEITGTKLPEALILTHLPVDLLARYKFQKLELLESHTGNIKPYPQWNTKLTGGKELVNIPFNAFTLQVFGDNGHHFAPLLQSLRKEVLRLAEKDGWTTVTTVEKIRFSLRKIVDPTTRALLMSLL